MLVKRIQRPVSLSLATAIRGIRVRNASQTVNAKSIMEHHSESKMPYIVVTAISLGIIGFLTYIRFSVKDTDDIGVEVLT